MSTFYYPNNELLPRWSTPEGGRSWKPLLYALAALLVIGLAWWLRPNLESTAEAERRAKAATVCILVVGHDSKGKEMLASGSGVIISPKGYILTNRHVITCAERSAKSDITVITSSGTPQQKIFTQVSIADKSKEPWLGDALEKIRNDWCVLQISQKELFDSVALHSKTTFKEQEKLVSYGFPKFIKTMSNDRGPEVKVLEGKVTRLGTGNGGGQICISHDTPIDHGSSGGPVLQDGKLVGINTAGLDDARSESWAIPAYLLKESVFDKYGK